MSSLLQYTTLYTCILQSNHILEGSRPFPQAAFECDELQCEHIWHILIYHTSLPRPGRRATGNNTVFCIHFGTPACACCVSWYDVQQCTPSVLPQQPLSLHKTIQSMINRLTTIVPTKHYIYTNVTLVTTMCCSCFDQYAIITPPCKIQSSSSCVLHSLPV